MANLNRIQSFIKKINTWFKKQKHLAAILVFAFIAIGFIYAGVTNHLMNKKGIYTIGTVVKIKGAHGGWNGNYVYHYLGEEYKGSAISEIFTANSKGMLVLIKFLPQFPSICHLETDYGINQNFNLDEVPEEGWLWIPGAAYKR